MVIRDGVLVPELHDLVTYFLDGLSLQLKVWLLFVLDLSVDFYYEGIFGCGGFALKWLN